MSFNTNTCSMLKSTERIRLEKENTNGLKEYDTEILSGEEKTEILYQQSAEPFYYLVAKKKENIVEIPIDSFPFYIGKEEKCNQLVLKENSVSRLHAVLTIKEGEILLTDLGSTNGTHVNGQKIEKNMPIQITNSDELAFSREIYLLKVKGF